MFHVKSNIILTNMVQSLCTQTFSSLQSNEVDKWKPVLSGNAKEEYGQHSKAEQL